MKADTHAACTQRRLSYETRGIALDRAQIAGMAAQSYWEQRTFQAFDTSVEPHLFDEPEERDAVLSVLWRLEAATCGTAARVLVVPIAARVQAGPALLVRFAFDPPASAGDRRRLRIERVVAGAASTPLAAPAAPANYSPSRPGMTFRGFPPAQELDPADAYFFAHPDEHRALFRWMETAAPSSFDHVVTTHTRGLPGDITHRSVFHVAGTRRGTTLEDLRIDLVKEGAIEPLQSAPADYRRRDLGDLELERLQARSAAADRLGPVTLSQSISAVECLSVKEAIRQYFEAGARDTEIHALVPVGFRETALYVISFDVTNAVTVTRVGEAGTSDGQIDARRIDVRRVNGFPGSTAAPEALSTWWQRRYPGAAGLLPGPPAGLTAAALIAAMNRKVAGGLVDRAWFERNYGIEVLDAVATAARLEGTHGVPRDLTGDTCDLDVRDLCLLELSLETLSDAEVSLLRGIRVGRKTSSLSRDAQCYRTGGAALVGTTLTEWVGADRETTVLYFQLLYRNDASLFRGDTAANALPDAVMNVLHELGHAIGDGDGLRAAFDAWVLVNPQLPPTWYAASAPSTELLPEAFALYHTERLFLRDHYPRLDAWLDHVAKTGRAPVAEAW